MADQDQDMCSFILEGVAVHAKSRRTASSYDLSATASLFDDSSSDDETSAALALPPPSKQAEQDNARALREDVFVIGEKQLKNPKLFPPPATEGLDAPRIIVYSRPGDAIEMSIQILGNNVTSGYTTETLDVIGALNGIWTAQGSNPDGWIEASYAEVVKFLEQDGDKECLNPTRMRRLVKNELERLRRCVLVFSQFHNKDSIKQNLEVTYLSEYGYIQDKANPSNNRFRAQLNPNILHNLLNGYIASLPYSELRRAKHPHTKPIILRVDSVLASQDRYELTSERIYEFASISLTSQWLNKPVMRKKKLTEIRDDMDGMIITSGWEISVKLERTAGGDDFKLCFARTRQTRQRASTAKHMANTDSDVVDQLTKNILEVVGDAERLKLYKLYAKSYPEELIQRALSSFKADRTASIQNPGAYFSTILHRIVREQGYKWIK